MTGKDFGAIPLRFVRRIGYQGADIEVLLAVQEKSQDEVASQSPHKFLYHFIDYQ